MWKFQIGQLVNFVIFQSKSKITDTIMKVLDVSYKDFDVYKVYGTREYLSSLGLTVSREFRGRRIGQRLLEARYVYSVTENS